jgi:hypothetical protein
MWQNSGDDDSNWTNFIKSNFPIKALPFGFRRYSGKYSVQQACPDTWNRCFNSSCFSAICPARLLMLLTTLNYHTVSMSSWRLHIRVVAKHAVTDAHPVGAMYMSTTPDDKGSTLI